MSNYLKVNPIHTQEIDFEKESRENRNRNLIISYTTANHFLQNQVKF